jgi:hypothetical protein
MKRKDESDEDSLGWQISGKGFHLCCRGEVRVNWNCPQSLEKGCYSVRGLGFIHVLSCAVLVELWKNL